MSLVVHRGYQMSVGLMLSLLNELNKSILYEPLASIIFYSASSINLVMNMPEFNILFITYPKGTLYCKKQPFFNDTRMM